MDSAVLKFKYHLLDAKGNPAGFLATKGEFDGEHVTLGKQKIPAQAIIKCISVSDRLVLVLMGEKSPVTIAMKICGGNIRKLHQTFNMIASVYQTQAHREMLEKAGRGHEFRVESCPHCRCMIDLTRHAPTPQVYCPFCDHFITRENPPADEKTFQLCGKCGLYSQPKVFTIIFFYFLLVIYGYRYKRVHMCNACARSEAWTMLWANLIFVLFVPMAIVQLIRAYGGGAARSEAFRGLDAANALQTAARYDRAVRAYEAIEQRLEHAGVLYNHARALQRAARVKEAVVIYERATAACANFPPAARELVACYTQVGRADDAARLKARWDDEPAEGGGAQERVALSEGQAQG